MFDQLRPPTDNLYKFVALSGLAILAAAGWTHLSVSLQVYKYDRDAMGVINQMIEEKRKFIAAELLKLADDLENGVVKTREETMARSHKIFVEDEPESYDKQLERLTKLGWSSAMLQRDHDPELLLLKGAMVIGMVMSGVGFWLWYVRVQRPLDVVMRSEFVKAQAHLAGPAVPRIELPGSPSKPNAVRRLDVPSE